MLGRIIEQIAQEKVMKYDDARDMSHQVDHIMMERRVSEIIDNTVDVFVGMPKIRGADEGQFA